ncbi:hypothetical protein ABZW32_19145 [Streptomyces sp. NPDC004667]|uniref:hypothetical protein n=1 Tax=Streptomyces sp. NPDC004667 TaxID=3154285 RepID=UPI0033BD7716
MIDEEDLRKFREFPPEDFLPFLDQVGDIYNTSGLQTLSGEELDNCLRAVLEDVAGLAAAGGNGSCWVMAELRGAEPSKEILPCVVDALANGDWMGDGIPVLVSRRSGTGDVAVESTLSGHTAEGDPDHTEILARFLGQVLRDEEVIASRPNPAEVEQIRTDLSGMLLAVNPPELGTAVAPIIERAIEAHFERVLSKGESTVDVCAALDRFIASVEEMNTQRQGGS